MRFTDQVAMGYAFGASLVSYLTDSTPRPFSATFAVTNRCNLRCAYCNYPYLDPTDLDFERLKGTGHHRGREEQVPRHR